jgi:hypothetical protein
MQPGDFTPAGPSAVVSWQIKRLAPPSNLYVQVDDVLRVAAASSQTNEVVTVNYRWLRASDATVQYGQFTVAPAANRTISVTDQPMAEGFLLSVSCKAAIATTRGQTFVRLFLNPKALGAGQPGYMLMADYVTTAMAPGHPNGRVVAPSEGPGAIVGVQLGIQPNGVDWTLTVPTNARWRVSSIMAALQTAAGGVNRQLTPTITDAGGLTFDRFIAGSQAGGTQFFYNFSELALESTTTVGGTSTVITPIPPGIILPGGSFIKPGTLNLLAGDQWFLVNAQVEEWLDNV